MAEATTNVAQKSDALEQAAMCAHRQKEHDRSMELARQIPLVPMSKTVQMRIMLENRKRTELIARFKDEDMSAWPEKAAGEAYYCRGRAYYDLKNGQAAEADLRKALENLPHGYARGLASLTLADNYRDNLKDDQQALEAYAYAHAIEEKRDRYGWMCFTSVASAAGVLRKQQRHDEALRMLGKVPVDKIRGYWRAAMLYQYGLTFAAQGKKAEALAKFNEALRVEGLRDFQKTECEKRIRELQTDGK
jgi:tetratricopeptide (TPR) repeat protein